MDRSNPYEAAFEGYLKAQGLCYIGIDETRRACLGDVPVKNLDFIVHGACGSRLLVDVKGRRFPGGTPEKPRYVWENWATQEDLVGLGSWTDLFGPGCVALFMFMYKIGPNVELPADSLDLWTFREQQYLLRAVARDDYLAHMKVRSPKWGTVSLPGAAFQKVARPFRYFTHELVLPEEMRDGPDAAGGLSQSLESTLASRAAGGGEAGRRGP